MKKIRIAAAILLLLLFFAAMAVGVKSIWFPPPVQIPGYAEITPAEKLTAGAENHYRFTVSLPLNLKINNAVFIGEKCTASPPEVTFSSYLGDRVQWLVQGAFRALEPGKFTGAAVETALNSGEIFIVKLPDAEVTALPGSEKLALAPVPPMPQTDAAKAYIIITAAAVLLTAALAVFILVRKKKMSPPLPPGEYALKCIKNNNNAAQKNDISPEKAVAVLSDILREYLEKRFMLPACCTATDEFIRELGKSDTAGLPDDAKLFLTGFMNRADMVKFAGESAGKEQLDRLSFSAAEMIRNAEKLLTGETRL